jgi:hypothetical protein
MRRPRRVEIIKESRNIQPNRLTELPARSTEKMMSSFQGNGSDWQKQQGMKCNRTNQIVRTQVQK